MTAAMSATMARTCGRMWVVARDVARSTGAVATLTAAAERGGPTGGWMRAVAPVVVLVGALAAAATAKALVVLKASLGVASATKTVGALMMALERGRPTEGWGRAVAAPTTLPVGRQRPWPAHERRLGWWRWPRLGRPKQHRRLPRQQRRCQ
jgi:hypothetical protein